MPTNLRRPYSAVRSFGESDVHIQGPNGRIVCTVQAKQGEPDHQVWSRATDLAKRLDAAEHANVAPLSVELSSTREGWQDVIAAAILALVGYAGGFLTCMWWS